MALQSSGAISITDIRTELGSSSYSLRTLSAAAGFSTPDAMSEFYGYTSMTSPSITTNAITGVTVTNMTLNGNVTSDGGATVTSRGFYFGTSSNVTSNPQYSSGSGTGAFSLNVSVTGSTTYYCAAYATNAAGTTIGSTVSATSQAPVAIANYSNVDMQYINHYGENHSNAAVSAEYYWQYNHPNYGWTNIQYYYFYQAGNSGYGYGNMPSGQLGIIVNGDYKRRADSAFPLPHRTYLYGTLSGNGSSLGYANWTGGNQIAAMLPGTQYGTGLNYSTQSTSAWPNSLGSTSYGPTYGGGYLSTPFTGCCYSFNMTGFIDNRN